MTDFIATVSPDNIGNWDICKRDALWGVVEKSGMKTGSANARRVRAGDRIFIWLGKPKRGPGVGGVKAHVEALGPYEPATSGSHIPWPHPEDYAGTFPVRLVAELDLPE